MPRHDFSDGALPIAFLALMLGSALGCKHQALLADDAIIHTDRPGYTQAYARNETLLAAGGRPALLEASVVPANAAVVDLTYPFGEDTLYWPGDHSEFHLQRLHYGNTNAGWFYAANRFSAPEHGGTHLDAPLHFAEGHPAVEAVPLERLIAPAVVLDMKAAAAEDPDALLGPADIDAFEATHGPIRPGTIVLVRTGWGSRWPHRRTYLGGDGAGNANALHFPGISAEAAALLVERAVAAVGIDTASIDHGPSTDFQAHRILLGADVPAFENVARLDVLPARGATIIALPMKIQNGTGAPLRIVAVVPKRVLAARD